MYGPEYMLEEEVILVTANFRLGVLGTCLKDKLKYHLLHYINKDSHNKDLNKINATIYTL